MPLILLAAAIGAALSRYSRRRELGGDDAPSVSEPPVSQSDHLVLRQALVKLARRVRTLELEANARMSSHVSY